MGYLRIDSFALHSSIPPPTSPSKFDALLLRAWDIYAGLLASFAALDFAFMVVGRVTKLEASETKEGCTRRLCIGHYSSLARKKKKKKPLRDFWGKFIV